MTDSSGGATVHIIVEGLVQGVGFRWFVARIASRLGLGGFVRNLPEGSVEILATGERGDLGDLIRQVRTGPRSARVRDVRIDWINPDRTGPEQGERFEIR